MIIITLAAATLVLRAIMCRGLVALDAHLLRLGID